MENQESEFFSNEDRARAYAQEEAELEAVKTVEGLPAEERQRAFNAAYEEAYRKAYQEKLQELSKN